MILPFLLPLILLSAAPAFAEEDWHQKVTAVFAATDSCKENADCTVGDFTFPRLGLCRKIINQRLDMAETIATLNTIQNEYLQVLDSRKECPAFDFRHENPVCLHGKCVALPSGEAIGESVVEIEALIRKERRELKKEAAHRSDCTEDENCVAVGVWPFCDHYVNKANQSYLKKARYISARELAIINRPSEHREEGVVCGGYMDPKYQCTNMTPICLSNQCTYFDAMPPTEQAALQKKSWARVKKLFDAEARCKSDAECVRAEFFPYESVENGTRPLYPPVYYTYLHKHADIGALQSHIDDERRKYQIDVQEVIPFFDNVYWEGVCLKGRCTPKEPATE